MRWTVHGERPLYESEWVRLTLVDVELPDGPRFEHHVVRTPHDAAGAVVYDAARGLLLIWRHRFITDTWGWEIPAGRIDPGEAPIDAAFRETVEETGWQPGPLAPLTHFHPTNGLSDQTFHCFVADGATHIGDPTDRAEAERIEWLPLAQVRGVIQEHQMLDGLSLTAVSYAFAFGAFEH